MSHTCRIELDGKSYDFPTVEGTEHELAVDITTLRDRTGFITLDDGYGNTGSCTSDITYIDGDKGILRYRGIPIEQLAEKGSFVETAWLVIWGVSPRRRNSSVSGTDLPRMKCCMKACAIILKDSAQCAPDGPSFRR